MIKIRISYENERDAVEIVEALRAVLEVTGRPRVSLQGQYKKLYIDADMRGAAKPKGGV